MSLKAMAWAIEQDCGSPSAKVTLWSIANHADKDTWLAWPSQDSISKETEQSHDSVSRRIPELEKLGLVRRIPMRYAGRRSVDLYILPPSPFWVAELDEFEPHHMHTQIASAPNPERRYRKSTRNLRLTLTQLCGHRNQSLNLLNH